jgi:hypothetical protein
MNARGLIVPTACLLTLATAQSNHEATLYPVTRLTESANRLECLTSSGARLVNAVQLEQMQNCILTVQVKTNLFWSKAQQVFAAGADLNLFQKIAGTGLETGDIAQYKQIGQRFDFAPTGFARAAGVALSVKAGAVKVRFAGEGFLPTAKQDSTTLGAALLKGRFQICANPTKTEPPCREFWVMLEPPKLKTIPAK